MNPPVQYIHIQSHPIVLVSCLILSCYWSSVDKLKGGGGERLVRLQKHFKGPCEIYICNLFFLAFELFFLVPWAENMICEIMNIGIINSKAIKCCVELMDE